MLLRSPFALFGLSLLALTCHAQSVPATTGSAISQVAAQAALDLHNRARQDVGTAPLAWSAELADFAQQWANYLATDKGCRMEHRPRQGAWSSPYGENIFLGSAASYTPRDAAHAWYSEIRDYQKGPFGGDNWYKVGHYTQMVWKRTAHVGMGQAVCANGSVIIVANYDPAGNFMGQEPY